ncbi:hypothetical protein Tsubulata_020365, partial [Turnera subulata]
MNETHNLMLETVEQQYKAVTTNKSDIWGLNPCLLICCENVNVKARTSVYCRIPCDGVWNSTHHAARKLFLYQGFDPAIVNFPPHNGLMTGPTDIRRWVKKKTEILKLETGTMKGRNCLDGSMELIGTLKINVFETHCGSLTQYGMKHMRSFNNICNAGLSQLSSQEACVAACNDPDLGQWNH